MADNYCNCCGDGAPEYIIELNQQGAPGKRGDKGEQGYSPVVDFIANDNEIRFTSTNEDNITSTPNLYDFVAKNDLSNVSNLYNLVAKKDLSNVDNLYDLVLKTDGSNATDTFSLNKIRFITNNSTTQRISSLDNTELRLSGNILRLDGEALGNQTYPNRIIISELGRYITLGNTDKANIIINNDMATYNGNELATVNNISDSKITITQGNVVKGSFTLNQSGDTTIELDTGVTNPLKITKDNKTLEIGYDENDRVYISNTTTGTGGGTSTNIALITPNVYHDPIRLQQITSIPGLEGEYYVKLNYDNNTLKLNESNQLYTDFTEVNNSITGLTTLVDNTEASLNELKTDYEANKTEVAGELTNLGNQLNNKANISDLANYVPLATYNELLARVEALEAEINGGNA